MVVANKMFDNLERDKLILDTGIVIKTLDDIQRAHSFRFRDEVENDPTWRQPIPYCLVMNDKQEIVLMQRMKQQAEVRLHGKHYIGAGGHVEEGHTVSYTALKECTEELGLPLSRLEPQGILITTGGPVEDVHICIFYAAMTTYTRFCSPESELHNARWLPKNALVEFIPHMEKWSQVICRNYLNIN